MFQKNHGKIRTDESYRKAGRKISLSKMGHFVSESTKMKISRSQKKRLEKIPVWNKGKTHKEDPRIKIFTKEELRKRGKLISKGRIGVKLSEKDRQKMRERAISYLKRGWTPSKETSIEKKIERELRKRKIYYKKQVPLCNVTIVDFYLPEHQLVIYCDGDYWHNRPEAREKDERQNKILKENGFKVFRFWEHEINKSPKACLDKIKIYLKI